MKANNNLRCRHCRRNLERNDFLLDVTGTARGRKFSGTIHAECFELMRNLCEVIVSDPLQWHKYEIEMEDARSYQNYDVTHIGTRRASELTAHLQRARDIDEILGSRQNQERHRN